MEMSVFIDSSGFVAYYNSRDTHHEKAIQIFRRIFEEGSGLIFTSDYVFDESVTVTLFRTRNLEKAIQLGERLLYSEINIINVTDDIIQRAWSLFKEKGNLSFTDCTNVILMKDFSIGDIVTFDQGFNQFKDIQVLPE